MENVEIDKQELKTKSVHSAALNMVTQMIRFGIMFVNQIILARLLMPSDFGLVAMVTPIIAFVQLFAEFGLTQATIQRHQITQAELSFLFWANFASSAVLALTVAALSPLVGMFYSEPRVVAIAVAIGLTFLMSGLYTQQMAIMTRHFAFVKIASIDITSAIVSMAAGIIAAYNGLGYWSLVVNHATLYFCNLIGAWTLSSWRPNKPQIPENWKNFIGFGGNLTGFNFVNYFSRNLDNILIGRFNGEMALALYDRAYKLLLLPLQQVSQPFNKVAIPLLSRLQKEDVLYRKAYRKMMEVVIVLTYPGTIFAIVTNDILIRTVLGDRWAEVGPIFAILGLNALLTPFGQGSGWLFISQARTKEMRNWGVFSAIVFTSSFVIGLPWGPLGVATCYTIASYLQGPVVWWASTRSGPVSYRDIWLIILPQAVSAAICGATVYGLNNYVFVQGGIVGLVVMMACAYLSFVGTLFLFPSGRTILLDILSHGLSIAGKIKSKKGKSLTT